MVPSASKRLLPDAELEAATTRLRAGEQWKYMYVESSRIAKGHNDCDTPEMTISATELQAPVFGFTEFVGREAFNVGHFCFYNYSQVSFFYVNRHRPVLLQSSISRTLIFFVLF